jgi:hypothetical protein
MPVSYFVCKGCSLHIGIPTDKLAQPFEDQGLQPTGIPYVVIQCPRCNDLRSYAPEDYTALGEGNNENGMAFVGFLQCGVEGCKSPAPVFARESDSTTPEDNQKESGIRNTNQPIPALYCRGSHPVAAEKVRELLHFLEK